MDYGLVKETIVNDLQRIKLMCDTAEVGRKGIAVDQISEIVNSLLRRINNDSSIPAHT
jgi:CRISPR/Cas system CSM-associated protein Csm2 small subunit